jgi:hypothetical protein
MRALLLLLVGCSHAAIHPDVSDATRWRAINIDAHPTIEAGKHIVTLAPVGGNRKGSNVGMALVAGLALDEGTIDVDLRSTGDVSFMGIAFAVTDPSHYEAVYFRPFRFRATNPIERSHAVQYVAWPDHTWEALRTASPGSYEAAIAPVPDPAGWFHARIEVARTRVRVFVDGAAQPTLEVQRLGSGSGAVGLWVDSQPASFANLEIHRR